jgi:Flp pilus assembly protein TadD
MRSPEWKRLRRGLFCVLVLAAGNRLPGVADQQQSHVERFARPEAKLHRAVEEATTRLRADPKNVQAHLDRGSARLRLGQLDAALDDFRSAVSLNPSSADAQAHLCFALWTQGRLQLALAAAREAMAHDPDNPSALRYAGRLLLLTGGDRRTAIQYLQRAAILKPEETDIHFDLLMSYRSVGDAPRAWAQFRLLNATYPTDNARVLYVEGLLAQDQGRSEFAIERFRRAVVTDPSLRDARNALAKALVENRRWHEALEVLGPLTKDDPQSFLAAYLHALALYQVKAAREAEPEARRAVSLGPRSSEAYALLGDVLAQEGRPDEARAAQRRARELDSENREERTKQDP